MSSPGCLPVSRTIFALPSTACAAKRYACALGMPSATAASAIASININTYAGELPLTPTTTSIISSSTISVFPNPAKIRQTVSTSSLLHVALPQTQLMPSPTSAGVFGMVRTIFNVFSNNPSIHVSFFPGAIETTMVSSATTSRISLITSS